VPPMVSLADVTGYPLCIPVPPEETWTLNGRTGWVYHCVDHMQIILADGFSDNPRKSNMMSCRMVGRAANSALSRRCRAAVVISRSSLAVMTGQPHLVCDHGS
jgi:hypothetical protein